MNNLLNRFYFRMGEDKIILEPNQKIYCKAVKKDRYEIFEYIKQVELFFASSVLLKYSVPDHLALL